jgi:hypothetical protein
MDRWDISSPPVQLPSAGRHLLVVYGGIIGLSAAQRQSALWRKRGTAPKQWKLANNIRQ